MLYNKIDKHKYQVLKKKMYKLIKKQYKKQ
jgi:hypothetical protein